MKMGEVDGKKIGCTVSLLVCIILFFPVLILVEHFLVYSHTFE